MIGLKIETSKRKVLSKKITFLLIYSPVVFIISYAILKGYILPPRFFYDEGTIFLFMKGEAGFVLGDSYSSTAAFFNDKQTV